MPQKIILQRPPLLAMSQAPLTNGCAVTDQPQAMALYQALLAHQEDPESWLGLFELSCLVTANPMEEPAGKRITAALAQSEDASLPGDFFQQLQTARAALAAAEYTCDKGILQRLSKWCRWIEINWDQLAVLSRFRIAPADWMEFLVRFYQMTGLKAILRLCTRLRSGVMDWTTVLHSFGKQKRREDVTGEAFRNDFLQNRLDEGDFFTREQIICHGELLADGMRYTALAAIFSGNGQEMSAGKTGWKAIRKGHYAICGGTTGAPFLSGLGSDQPVSLAVLSAWAEAFGAQLYLGDSEWALDELIRIKENGFAYAVGQAPVAAVQYVNHPDPAAAPAAEGIGAGPVHTLSRAAHAMSLICRLAVTVGRDQVRFNYPMTGKFLLHSGKTVLLGGEDEILIKRAAEPGFPFLVYSAGTETRDITVERSGEIYVSETQEECAAPKEGTYTSFDMNGLSGTSIRYARGVRILEEDTHHQGKCYFAGNRLMAATVTGQDWKIAAAGHPAVSPDGEATLVCAEVPQWKKKNGLPGDLPVMPRTGETERAVTLAPYKRTGGRMAMLPTAFGK